MTKSAQTENSQTTLKGGCHCGEVRFQVTLKQPIDAALDVDECNCSMCQKVGYLHLIVDAEQFELLSPQDQLSEYKFNSHVARHLFCRQCGVKSFYVPRSHPQGYSVNARCLDDFDRLRLAISRFDGANWEANIKDYQQRR